MVNNEYLCNFVVYEVWTVCKTKLCQQVLVVYLVIENNLLLQSQPVIAY